MRGALCREVDPELFFPERHDSAKVKIAKRVCGACPVVEECLRLGMSEEHGIFGGKTVEERAALKQRTVSRGEAVRQRNAEILALHDSGIVQVDIAERFGVSQATVSNVIRTRAA